MKSFLRRLFKFIAYTVAGVVIALAIAVGLFRLFLPRLPEYQGELKAWASNAIGMEVEFSGMDARWGLSGPELEFYDAELVRPSTQARVIAAQEVRLGVGLMRLLVEGKLVVDRVVVSGTSVEIRQLEGGRWWVQGSPADTLFGPRATDTEEFTEVVVVGEDIEILFLQPGDERPRVFDVPRAVASVDGKRLAIDADVGLPEDLGRDLELSATQLLDVPTDERHWDVLLEATDVNLAGWSALRRADDWQVLSGSGDLDLSLAYANGSIRSATAEVDLTDLALSDGDTFDLAGRFEFSAANGRRLVAADDFRLVTPRHGWPEARLRAEASVAADGGIAMLDLRASYLRLDDVALFAPWLKAEQRQLLADFDPSGVVRDLTATLRDIGSGTPGFDVEADLDVVGFKADNRRPGIRGFSGKVHANQDGGRIEIRSTDASLELQEYYEQPINISAADGIVIWRNTATQTTILTDRIRIGNTVVDSESNVQLTLPRDGGSPEIDLASSWSINDLSAVRGFLPAKIMKPKLQQWFQTAFAEGSIPSGTVVLRGPLDQFPFDDGDGQFRVDATIRNLVFDYHPRWPSSNQTEMQIVLDGTRLYSERNSSLNSGNRIVNAKVEIADLRDPVLTVDAFSTGTLETIRQFTSRSPIADVFGGQLERIAVTGDATFRLELSVPLLSPQEFDFTSTLQSTNGTMTIEGFGPPLTNLSGEVTILRGDISSDALTATFLGEPVTIELAVAEDPRFTVVASTIGRVGAEALVDELGLPLEGVLVGSTDYQSRILFPETDSDTPARFTIQIDSNLEGMSVELPEPVGKAADTPLSVRGDIRLIDGGERLETAGFAENGTAWQLAFDRTEEGWDIDRGVIALGRDGMEEAETRGLHIRGTTGTVRFDDWLAVSRRGEEQSGVAERIRSIDLVIDDLFAVGQHLQSHHVRVDRSARDWLVQVDGEHVVGSIFVPYDFDSDRAMVVEMQKLHLPGDDVSPEDTSEIDPRTLPPISVQADDFALGNRLLGALEAQIDRVPDGLQATSIVTSSDTFGVTATGRWVFDESDPLRSRTYTTGSLVSTDVETTMTRLDFAPGIVSSEMTVDFDLDFSGRPRAEFLDVLDGEVQVAFGAGQLEEVEPGAGRMFGLMSITALPRRLSLDFRDVFNKGFGFDSISGTFRLEDGEAYTCDLSLEGPAADIGVVGRVSVADRVYEQSAVVSANFGNTLPIMGAVVAGPQAAAALLIFSQIFKKPLQEVGQVYYGIGGTWDEPELESTDPDSFALDSDMAGCLAGAE